MDRHCGSMLDFGNPITPGEKELTDQVLSRRRALWGFLVEMICRQVGPFIGYDRSNKIADLAIWDGL